MGLLTPLHCCGDGEEDDTPEYRKTFEHHGTVGALYRAGFARRTMLSRQPPISAKNYTRKILRIFVRYRRLLLATLVHRVPCVAKECNAGIAVDALNRLRANVRTSLQHDTRW